MKHYKKAAYAFIIGLGLLSCEGGFELDPVANIDPIENITLLAPVDSEVCDATLLQSGSVEVNFQWTVAGDFTGEYTLTYTNTFTGSIQTVVSNMQMVDVVLESGARYTWNVSANVNGAFIEGNGPFVTVTPGLQEESYPPFLSDIQVNLQSGSTYQIDYLGIDPDGDTISYDVFIDTINPPTNQIESDISQTQLFRDLNPDTTYYIKVVAKDGTGNQTESSRSFNTSG